MLALEGKQLGNYDVVRRIRVGGMGAVYDGRQRTAFGRRVAIKVILGNYATDPEMRRRFAREARTIAGLHHPHILPLIEYGDEQGILYLVMPFIDGGTLTSYLHRSLPDLNEVAAIFLQLLDAVEYAHDQGLIHRDIKSSNVLLEMRRNGPPYPYLADFGLVRTSRQAESEQEGIPIPLDQVPGTPHYMAPEQTRGIVTTSSDIYALGVLLYQMLIGELPYDDPDEVAVIQMHLSAPIPSPCTRDASIPLELGEVVRVAMAKRPEERFHSVAELRAAFLAALEGSRGSDIVGTEDVILADEEAGSLSTLNPLALSPMPPYSQYPPAPLALPEPTPIAMKRRAKSAAVAISAPKPVRAKQAIVQPIPKKAGGQPQRKGRSKSFTFSIVAATLVPTVLLILVIMPRVLGFSFFPAGFPLFGTPAIATVDVTAQSRVVQDTYLLIASPQITSPDSAGRVLPDRTIQAMASENRSIATTGTKSITAAQATGMIVFTNSGDAPVSLHIGFPLETTSGIEVQLTQAAEVPPRQNGADGSITASAIAALPGAAGNIPARALDSPCCTTGVSVSNPQPFVGGVDAQVMHVVTEADLDGLKNILSADVQKQVLQQLKGQLQANEAMAGDPTYTTSIFANNPVGAVADQLLVKVNISAMVSVYNQNTVLQMVSQLLKLRAQQTLSNHYQLQPGSLIMNTPQVVSPQKDGVVHLSVMIQGLWVYYLSPQQLRAWRQSIKDATPALAISFLNAQPGVAQVQIHLPFGSSTLPTTIDQIQIELVGP